MVSLYLLINCKCKLLSHYLHIQEAEILKENHHVDVRICCHCVFSIKKDVYVPGPCSQAMGMSWDHYSRKDDY